MQVKLLHDLVEEMAGEGAGRIVEILFRKKDVNEFLIAKKMNLTINQVRNILYKLSADNLVAFIRKKDKRKGWYIYYWTLNTEKCLIKLEDSLLNKIASLEATLNSRETKRYYICRSCDIEVSEEKALENGFSCEECADIYELNDNSATIRDIKTKTTKVRKDLSLIQNELEEIRKKLNASRKRVANKAVKEKEAKAKLLKKAKEEAKKKIAKKAIKKVVKKAKKKVIKKVAKKIVKKAVKKAIKKDTKKPIKKAVTKKQSKKKISKKK